MRRFLFLILSGACFEVNTMEFHVENPSHLFATSLLGVHEKTGSFSSLKKVLQQKISDFWELSRKNTFDNSDFFSYNEYVKQRDLLVLLEKFQEKDKEIIKEKARSLGEEVYSAVLVFMGENSEDFSSDEGW